MHQTSKKLGLCLLLAGLVAVGRAHAAEPFPSHQMRIVAPFPPGGTVDLLARIAGQQLTAALGQQVVVENRTGAGGNIGGDIVAKAPPDGYTMLLGTTGVLSVNAAIYRTMPFDPARDFAPVIRLATVPNLMVINPDLPVHSVAEFIAYAKARPGKVFFASAGAGTTIHLSGELFKKMAGIDLVHTPYRGSAPALADLMAGQVQVMFDNMPSALPLAQSGKLRALAVTTATRAPAVPDVPTIAESGLPGYETAAWFGILVPAATPHAVVETLSRALAKAMALPDVRQRLTDLGATASPDTPEDFRAFIAAETAKWGQLARDAHVTVD
jgi:tripartite-type tricarboxylate transporter receptor subunit TctC